MDSESAVDDSGHASGTEQSEDASRQGASMYSDEEGVSVYDENVAKNHEPKEALEERKK